VGFIAAAVSDDRYFLPVTGDLGVPLGLPIIMSR